MSLPKTLSFSNMRIVRQYPRSVYLHPAFPCSLSSIHQCSRIPLPMCMYSSVQIKFFIHFVVQLSQLPVGIASAAGDLDRVQVARKGHPSCASFGHYLCGHMPSIPINTTQDRLLCPYIASILARNQRQQVYHRDDPKELVSQLPAAKVNSIFIYNELTYLTT